MSQLQTFLAVYRLGSITAAAVELGMTQPGASQHIQILENKFGKSLFTRQARGVVATVFADDLAKKIASQFAQIEDAVDDLSFNETALKGDVYIGGPVSYITAKLLNPLATLNQYQLNIHFSFGGKERIYDLLNNHEIDFAITASKIENADLMFEAIDEENLICVAGNAFAIQHQLTQLSQAQLLQKPIVAYDSELPLIRDFFGLALLELKQIKPAFMVPDLRSMVDLVISNVGLAVLPEYLCNEALAANKMVQIRANNKQLSNAIYLVSPLKVRQNQRIKFVKQFIKNIQH